VPVENRTYAEVFDLPFEKRARRPTSRSKCFAIDGWSTSNFVIKCFHNAQRSECSGRGTWTRCSKNPYIGNGNVRSAHNNVVQNIQGRYESCTLFFWLSANSFPFE